MNDIKNNLRAWYRALRGALLGEWEWKRRRYAAPSPTHVKWEVLLRNGVQGGLWVETGTYLGETTSRLASLGRPVYTVEPQHELYTRAKRKFKRQAHVRPIHGTSEEIFPQLLPTLSGAANFWLDGHYSAGITYRGANDTPIVTELHQIETSLRVLDDIAVFVDDVRCFNPNVKGYETYPPLDYLVDWARRNDLAWHIEHDIFIARTAKSGGNK